jgi:hypothetical protein
MTKQPPYRVLAYRGSKNLGDAIQTVALARWLPGPLVGTYRDTLPHLEPEHAPRTILNGWLGYHSTVSAAARGVVTAGVHFGTQHAEWVRASDECFAHPVGCRDPFTRDLLTAAGVPARMVGCATLTFARYSGPRAGEIRVNYGTGGDSQDNTIPHGMGWRDQWAAALGLLRRLRTAARVYTTRLHVALPCLAMGTPVWVDDRGAAQPERFSVLDWLGVPRREFYVLPEDRYQDVKWQYLTHVGEQLTCPARPGGVEGHDLVSPEGGIPFPEPEIGRA